MMDLNIVVADPAGNRTIFVSTPVKKTSYVDYANKLLSISALDGEQVGYIVPPVGNADGRLEMMGGEFCGNAARSFGFLLANALHITQRPVSIEISGCSSTLDIEVDLENSSAKAQMPVPLAIEHLNIPDIGSVPVVKFTGITHIIIESSPLEEIAQRILSFALHSLNTDCIGILFLNGNQLTPCVHVIATNTTIWERSCGSGSLACGIFKSSTCPDGTHHNIFIQPGGTIETTVIKENGVVTGCFIGGPVSLDSPSVVTI